MMIFLNAFARQNLMRTVVCFISFSFLVVLIFLNTVVLFLFFIYQRILKICEEVSFRIKLAKLVYILSR